MESLFLLIPLSLVLVLGILVLFGWALQGGQFDDLEQEGERILNAEAPTLDVDQVEEAGGPEQFGVARKRACTDAIVPAGDPSWRQPPT
ncbi:MAG: cbb3-type cytochrome oxidase assembly protein CcoS [Rubrivivax sp.]